MIPRTIAILVCSFGTILHLHSQGYLVPNGVTFAGYDPGALGSIIHVVSKPNNGDHTGFTLMSEDASYFLFGSFLDEGVRVFLVSSNDPISLQPIIAESYPELMYPNTYAFDNGIPFYVGLHTGNGYPVNGIYPDPLFGWAQLINNAGIIDLIDGALEYGGEGIYAGTQTIIPEPRALALAALGTLLLGFRRGQPSAQ
jgi:hypothetical protein